MLKDYGGNGYNSEMPGADGASPEPSYVEGRFSHALQLDGNGGVRALIGQCWDIFPWIRVYRDSSNASPVLFSQVKAAAQACTFPRPISG